MKYSSHILVKTFIFIHTATWGACWQFFTTLSDLTLTHSTPDLICGTECKVHKTQLQRDEDPPTRPTQTRILQLRRVMGLVGNCPMIVQIHSEYQFGKCANKGKIFYTHIHLDRMDVLGKLIVRGWIKVMRIPTCIVIRGTSYDKDLVQSTSYNFQMCVPRISYCHTHQRFKFHYYEWYIPKDVSGGMDWDIYFFGPPSQFWQ